MTIEYNGEKYSGWQIQPNKKTIQGEIEHAIEVATKTKTNVIASGRTDAGVNALGQVAHFDIDKKIDTQKLAYSLNGILDNDIKILNIEESDIHARFSAKRKTYLYKMYLSNIDRPLKFKSLRIDENIDIDKMKNCAKLLVGKHDFKNFCASNSGAETTTRRIYSCKFKKTGCDLEFFVTGNGFLYKMVRNIVGLLLQVGQGKINEKEFEEYAFGDKKMKWTAPSQNLYLLDVKYN